jgi:hypothetical protein
LPEDFFTRNLYILPDPNGLIARLESENRWFYTISGKSWQRGRQVVFEASEDAKPCFEEFGEKLGSFVFIPEARGGTRIPYPLCKYSALVEILKGQVANPDWVAGCVDAAKDACDFYADSSRFVNHFYYDRRVWRRWKPPLCLSQAGSWGRYVKGQLKMLDGFLQKYA